MQNLITSQDSFINKHIRFSDNRLNEHHSSIFLCQNISQSLNDTQDDDFSFLKKFGKLVFKYSLSLKLNRTRQMEFITKLANLFSQESPSKPVLDYAREVFINPNRVEDYIKTNFNKFHFYCHINSDKSSIFIQIQKNF